MSAHATTDDAYIDDARASAAHTHPLRATYRALLTSLLACGGSAAAADAQIDEEADFATWCMRAIQVLTCVAPAVRRSPVDAASSIGSATPLQQQQAALVLQFLTTLLHHLQKAHTHASGGDDTGINADDGASIASSLAARPLLPFLYANLFKYCLQLREFDTFYELLVHMPDRLEEQSAASEHSSPDSLTEDMKLEYLKRFVIELLREHRIGDIVSRYSWSFSWAPPSDDNTATPEGARKTVREEVEQMLWWHAKSSDIQDELSASSTGGGSSARTVAHYETLYAFLLASHRYVPAAQAALHYFYRLESEVYAAGGLQAFIACRVTQAQKGRGRVPISAHLTSPAGVKSHATTHSEQSQSDANALTLQLLRAFLSRKLWALRAVEDALERAAPEDEQTVFMVEDSGARARDEAKTKEIDEAVIGESPLHKRARNAADDAEMADSAEAASSSLGRVELLSRAGLGRRLELLLAQFDLADALASGPAGVPLPSLDTVEFGGTIDAFVASLARFGLVDRAFHFAQVVYDVPTTAARGVDLANTRAAMYGAIVIYLFQLFAARVVRLTQLVAHDKAAEDAAAQEFEYPLRVEDSLQSMQLSGRGFTFAASTAAADDEDVQLSLRLREAEAVLRHLLDRYDGPLMRASETVAHAFINAGLDVPLWMQARYTKFMQADDDEEDELVNEVAAPTQSAFRIHARAAPSAHARTLRSFPFLSFLRMLLEYKRFDLLHELSLEYLSWLSSSDAASSRSAASADLSRTTMVDIIDGFLFLQREAESLRGDDAAGVQAQVREWVDTITQAVHTAINAGTMPAAASAAAQPSKAAEPVKVNTAPATAFNSTSSLTGSFTSRFAPAPSTSFSSAPPLPSTSLRFSAATPSASPAVAPAPAAASPFASFAPAASPFANDFSAAATPSKSAAAAAPTASFGFGGFGAASATTTPSFGFGAKLDDAQKTSGEAKPISFASPFASGAAAATPFSFGGFK